MKPFSKNQFWSTLRETSYDDDSKTSMIPKNTPVYDFDEIKRHICSFYRGGQELRSCDAYYITNERREILIEFKNRKRAKIPQSDIKSKIFDSVYLLMHTFDQGKTVEQIINNLTVYVIFNDNKESSENKIRKKFAEFAKQPPGREKLYFDLEKFQNLLFTDVHTVDVEYFNQVYYHEIFGHSKHRR